LSIDDANFGQKGRRQKWKKGRVSSLPVTAGMAVSGLIRLCHTAAILSRETEKALFYHAEARSQNREGEAKRGKTKLFWSPGTIWPPCDKDEWPAGCFTGWLFILC